MNLDLGPRHRLPLLTATHTQRLADTRVTTCRGKTDTQSEEPSLGLEPGDRLKKRNRSSLRGSKVPVSSACRLAFC